jgi:acyl carrier protein
VAPVTANEVLLAGLWAEALGLERIGIHDNFFQLGGHSLTAMQIVSRVRKQFGMRISYREFFDHPTLSDLSEFLKAEARPALAAIEPLPNLEYYDLSHGQHSLWLLHQMGGAAAYNMADAYVFDTIDLDALRRAFRTVIERHDSLRTAFVLIDGEPKQKILASVNFDIQETDLRGSDSPDEDARTIMNSAVRKTFNLNEPPLMRARLIRLGPSRFLFLLIMHHIIGDGWSSVVLEREISTLYDSYRRGLPSRLKDLRLQYRDFAAWQHARNFDREQAYWLKKMTPLPELLRLPYDLRAGEDRDFRGRAESLLLDRDVVSGLKSIAKGADTTLSNVVLALLNILLFQVTGQEDLCVGMTVANRNHPDLENLIGFFVNILPIRVGVAEDMEFEKLLREITQSTIEALDNQELPFELLVRTLHPVRYAGRQSIVNVVYTFQTIDLATDDSERSPQPGSVDGSNLFEFKYETSKFDLTLIASEESDALRLTMEYDSGVFYPDTICTFLKTMEESALMLSTRSVGELS